MKMMAWVLLSLVIFSTPTLAAEVVLEPVESSLIARAGYDAETQIMAIQMVNNSDTYYFKGVPQAVYDGFVAAESKGVFFNENIKGQFEENLAR